MKRATAAAGAVKRLSRSVSFPLTVVLPACTAVQTLAQSLVDVNQRCNVSLRCCNDKWQVQDATGGRHRTCCRLRKLVRAQHRQADLGRCRQQRGVVCGSRQAGLAGRLAVRQQLLREEAQLVFNLQQHCCDPVKLAGLSCMSATCSLMHHQPCPCCSAMLSLEKCTLRHKLGYKAPDSSCRYPPHRHQKSQCATRLRLKLDYAVRTARVAVAWWLLESFMVFRNKCLFTKLMCQDVQCALPGVAASHTCRHTT